MSFLKNLFGKKESLPQKSVELEPINSFEDFWNWFLKHEKKFHNIVSEGKYIEADFFNKMSPKLNQLKEGILCLAGMLDDDTADLILTCDGNIKNFYFVEQLIETSPKIENWNFRAHKPAHDIEKMQIDMGDYTYKSENIHFYSNNFKEYPDEISITIVHDDYNEKNKDQIINGCYIFLDNYLGELNLTTKVDTIEFIEKEKATEGLVPLHKLNDFIIWREKEFVEKYEGIKRNTEDDTYAGMEGKVENGNPLIAIINSDVLEWNAKASHPWVLTIEIKYDGKDNSGLPDNDTYQLLNTIEESLQAELKDFEGYLNVGRQTADNTRDIFYACKEFRKPCMILDKIISLYPKNEINYDIYKDKYWQSFERFRG